MVSVTAAGLPYRLVLPFKEGFEYVFSDLNQDPGELHLKLWTMKDLVDDVMSKHEASAAEWLEDAEQVGKWWVNEQRRIWGYRES